MTGPVLLPIAFAVAGYAAGDWSGAIVGLSVGLLAVVAVIVGASTWARQIGSLLEPEDAWANAPRPPGFGPLVDWVYARTLDAP